MARATVLAGLVPVAFQEMTLSNSTAVSLNSTVQAQASVLDVSVETNDVRYRMDGNPTLNTGILLSTGNGPYRFEGYNGAPLAFQRTTGTAKVSVQAYKQAGARG